MTETEFHVCLKKKFDPAGYALFPQVRNGTGFAKQPRTADALAVSLWPSRGIDVHGFEFKDSRTDWLKELKQPEKADEIGKYCAFWWVVVSSPAIFSADELPAAWGALHAKDDSVKVLKQAPRRPDIAPPSWSFVAAVLRAAKDCIVPDEEVERRVKRAKDAGYSQGHKDGLKTGEGNSERARRDLEKLQKQVRDFEEVSGVKLDNGYWSDGKNVKIGAAVRVLVGDNRWGSLKDDFERMAGKYRELADGADAAAKELDGAMPGVAGLSVPRGANRAADRVAGG